jgi:ribose/xylose/arabinose/galactoside ABC-type transport system permease subunit
MATALLNVGRFVDSEFPLLLASPCYLRPTPTGPDIPVLHADFAYHWNSVAHLESTFRDPAQQASQVLCVVLVFSCQSASLSFSVCASSSPSCAFFLTHIPFLPVSLVFLLHRCYLFGTVSRHLTRSRLRLAVLAFIATLSTVNCAMGIVAQKTLVDFKTLLQIAQDTAGSKSSVYVHVQILALSFLPHVDIDASAPFKL